MKRTLVVLLALIVALVVAVVPGAAATRSDSVKDNYFGPRSISISKGGSVTWIWRGNGYHNVVGAGVRSAVKKRGTFTHRFSKRGTYTFLCTVHPGMSMKVKVQ